MQRLSPPESQNDEWKGGNASSSESSACWGMRERPALQGCWGHDEGKTPASKLPWGSSMDPHPGSPRGSTPARQRDRASELTLTTCNWLYHLVWPQPYFTLLPCSNVVQGRWKLLIFPYLHARTKAVHCIFILASNSSLNGPASDETHEISEDQIFVVKLNNLDSHAQ